MSRIMRVSWISLFNQPPKSELPPPTKIEAAYRRAGQSIQIDRRAAGGVFSQMGTWPTDSFSDTTATADSA